MQLLVMIFEETACSHGCWALGCEHPHGAVRTYGVLSAEVGWDVQGTVCALQGLQGTVWTLVGYVAEPARNCDGPRGRT